MGTVTPREGVDFVPDLLICLVVVEVSSVNHGIEGGRVSCLRGRLRLSGYLDSHFDTNLVWGQLCSVGGVFLVGRHKSLGVISLRNNAQTRVSRWLLLLLRELNR